MLVAQRRDPSRGTFDDHAASRPGTSGFRRTGGAGARLRMASTMIPGCRRETAGGPSPSRRARRRTKTDRVRASSGCAADLLGGHVRRPSPPCCPDRSSARRPDRVAWTPSRRRLVGRGLRQTEIENLRSARGQEDVRRLDVAMDDALAVRGVERIGDGDARCRRGRGTSSGPRASRCWSVSPSSSSMAMNGGVGCRRRRSCRCWDG